MVKSAIFILDQTLSDEEDEDVANALEALLKVLRGIPSSTTLPAGTSHGRHKKWQEQCK